MCFHNSMTKKAKALQARYQAKANYNIEFENVYHANGFSFPLWSVITSAKPDELQLYRWGLVPRWIKTDRDAKKIRTNTLNARSETVFEKPSYSLAIKKQRCLVPSTGFFEWRDENKKKIPYYIQLNDMDIFSMAGIYEHWTNPDTGELLSTFSILTTQANPLMEYIHNTKKRMPVILSPENEKRWLSANITKDDIMDLTQPYNEKLMNAYTISSDFMNKAFNDESITLPEIRNY